VDSQEYCFTFSGDGSAVEASCVEPSSNAPRGSATTVTGTMKQAGSVQIGNTGSASATGPWTYTITTTAGLHDVYALDTANNAVFERALMFSGAATGPTIDTTNGAPLVSQPLTIGLLGSSTLQVEDSFASFDTDDFPVVSVGSAAVALSLPLSWLGSDDNQIFSLYAADATDDRTASRGRRCRRPTTS
jgi:hypothetical protein